MYIEVDRTGSVEALERILGQMNERDDVASVMVLACDANNFVPETLDPILAGCPKTLFGGTFPAVLLGREVIERGMLVVGIRELTHVITIEGMSDASMDYQKELEESVAFNDALSTLLVFHDGLASNVDSFIDGLYDMFGLEVNYIGGGAGSLTRGRVPCLITNHGMLQDCALLVEMSIRSGVGVAHGLQVKAGPFQVTEATGTTVHTLDWEPAMEVYRLSLEANGVVFPEECTPPEISLPPEMGAPCDVFFSHPLGMAKLGTEMVIRDPVGSHASGSIVFVGAIPEGSYVYILRADPERMIPAANAALIDATEQLCLDCKWKDDKCIPGSCSEAGSRGLWGLVVECVSRKLFMGPAFARELEQLQPGNMPILGICSLGEIANNGRDFLELFNKTSVVALLEGE